MVKHNICVGLDPEVFKLMNNRIPKRQRSQFIEKSVMRSLGVKRVVQIVESGAYGDPVLTMEGT